MIEPLKFTDLGSFQEFATMEIDRLWREVERMRIYEAAIKRICSEQLYAIEYLQIAKQAVADYEASK